MLIRDLIGIALASLFVHAYRKRLAFCLSWACFNIQFGVFPRVEFN